MNNVQRCVETHVQSIVDQKNALKLAVHVPRYAAILYCAVECLYMHVHVHLFIYFFLCTFWRNSWVPTIRMRMRQIDKTIAKKAKKKASTQWEQSCSLFKSNIYVLSKIKVNFMWIHVMFVATKTNFFAYFFGHTGNFCGHKKTKNNVPKNINFFWCSKIVEYGILYFFPESQNHTIPFFGEWIYVCARYQHLISFWIWFLLCLLLNEYVIAAFRLYQIIFAFHFSLSLSAIVYILLCNLLKHSN